MRFADPDGEDERVGAACVDQSIRIHRGMGHGLLESVYEDALYWALVDRGFHVERQVAVRAFFDGRQLSAAFRADLVVNRRVICELESIRDLTNADYKQVQTHINLTDLRLGFLLNFGKPLMKEGIRRFQNTRLLNGVDDTEPKGTRFPHLAE